MIEPKAGPLTRSMKLTLDYPYAEPVPATVRIEGQQSRSVELKFGKQTLDYTIAAAETSQTLNVAVDVGGESVASRAVTIEPARKLTGLSPAPLAHRHRLHGDPDRHRGEAGQQPAGKGMAAARRTANYPAGRPVRLECRGAVGAPISSCSGCRQNNAQEFVDAVKHGQVALNGMYLNELTGLCRPEELLRLFRSPPSWAGEQPACRWTRR